MQNNESQPTQNDARSTGFLIAIGGLCYFAVFGPAQAGRLSTPFLLETILIHAVELVIFLGFVGVAKKVLLSRVRRNAFHRNARRQITLREVHPQVRSMIAERCRALKLSVQVDPFYLPGTWNAVDAYVIGGNKRAQLIMTGGMQALYYSHSAEDRHDFGVLIDHELGHIAHRDTGTLYTALACIVVTPICSIIKTALPFLLWYLRATDPDRAFSDWYANLGNYRDIFPQIVDVARMYPDSKPVLHVSVQLSIVLHLAYLTVLTIVCFQLYKAIVRRREHWADLFAIENSPDKAKATQALLRLIEKPMLAKPVAHGFAGGKVFHPELWARQESIRAVSAFLATPTSLIAIVLFLAMLTFNFLFLNPLIEGYEVTVSLPPWWFLVMWTLWCSYCTVYMLETSKTHNRIRFADVRTHFMLLWAALCVAFFVNWAAKYVIVVLAFNRYYADQVTAPPFLGTIISGGLFAFLITLCTYVANVGFMRRLPLVFRSLGASLLTNALGAGIMLGLKWYILKN